MRRSRVSGLRSRLKSREAEVDTRHTSIGVAGWGATIALIIGFLNLVAPEQPPQLKAIFFAVSVMTVSGLVFVLLQMNRNDILSFITRTDPGRLSWDGAFTFNLALYVAVPLLTLLSSEIPEVREFLFSWVSPLLRALGKG